MEEDIYQEVVIGILWLDNELDAPSYIFFVVENGYFLKEDRIYIATIRVGTTRRYLLLVAQEL